VEKNLDASDIPGQRADNISGAIAAEIVTWFIILTTGTVLHPAGISINSAADAAKALVPLAGKYASVLFAVGLVGASFLAACVLPGITASAVCEAFGWERGADRTWREAPVYRGIITGITILSAVIILIPNVDLFGIMMVSQVINGVMLPVLLVCMVLIAADRHIMHRHANGKVWNGLTWFTIIAVTFFTIVMFVLQALGY
jgi:Mn2+/Fe2+ NRAMP family transporter